MDADGIKNGCTMKVLISSAIVSATAKSTTISVRNDQRLLGSSAVSSPSWSSASAASGPGARGSAPAAAAASAGPSAALLAAGTSAPASTSFARCSSFIITIQPNGQQASKAARATAGRDHRHAGEPEQYASRARANGARRSGYSAGSCCSAG